MGIAFVISFLLTWGISLTPPLLIRYVFYKKALSKVASIITSFFLWFTNVVIFISLGSQSRTHTALTLAAFISYWILRRGHEEEGKFIKELKSLSQSKTCPSCNKDIIDGAIECKHCGELLK